MNAFSFILMMSICQKFEAMGDNVSDLECSSNGICLQNDYNKHELPSQPVTVHVEIDITQVTEVNDVVGTVDFMAYMMFTWKDNRLIGKWNTGDRGFKMLEKEWHDKLWYPAIHLFEMKAMDFQISNAPHLNDPFGVWLEKNGTKTIIRVDQLMTVKFRCPMEFSHYPFDNHVCHFHLGSYIYDSKSVIFKLKELSESKFSIIKEDKETDIRFGHNFIPVQRTATFASFNYSYVGFTLILDRHFSPFILSYYFPSVILVIVSWISFMVPSENIPGRMALLITLLLVKVNLLGTVIRTQPSSSSPTLLVIWIIGCLMFVTAALLAYAALLWISKHQRLKIKQKNDTPLNSKEVDLAITTRHKLEIMDAFLVHWDDKCLALFPLAFLIFNGIYWPIVYSKV